MYVSHQLGIMGYLSWSVPMMAYALVSGSTYAMTGVVGSIDSAAKSGATKGAEVAGTGNLSMGNDSLHNYSAGNDSLSNYSASNKSMDNLSAMDIATNDTRRNNTSSNKYDTVRTHNTGTDLSQKHSVVPDGQVIESINPNTGQVDFKKTQDGVI